MGKKAKQQKSNKQRFVKKKNSTTSAKMSKKVVRKKKLYSESAVDLAIKAILEGVSYRKAADTFGVPVATLHRKKSCPEKEKKKSGPPTVLSSTEENEIVKWINHRAETGSPVTKSELIDSVQLYLKSLKKETPFTDNRPGRHWLEGFYKRHPHLSIRTAQNLILARASVSEEDIKNWFSEIKMYLTKQNLLNVLPSQVFNCDETSIQLCPKPDKVIVRKGAKSVYKVVDASERECVTALFMYSAEGTRAPPMILYPYKEGVPKKVLDNFPVDWGVGISESGWMTTESFYEYITNVFYAWLIKTNVTFPVILYLDGHSSHVTLPLVKFCKERLIEIISLYPHATHIMQPLDVALFHPFKELWKRSVTQWKITNNIMRLRKENVPAVIKLALDSFIDEKKVIVNGFRACGLMPFDANAINYNVLRKTASATKNSTNFTKQAEQENEKCETANEKELDVFEKILPEKLLTDFKENEEDGFGQAT